MADAMVNLIIEKMTAVISQEAELLGDVKGELEFIKDELNTMNAFLEDAEESQERARIKKEWVKRVRELAYDAEDCIDEFTLRVEIIMPPAQGLLGWFHNAGSFIRSLGARRWIASEVQRIKTKAKEASARAQQYGFMSVNPGTTTSCQKGFDQQHDPRHNALFVKESDLVGIEKPRDELIGWLLEEDEHRLDVISVVGTGGLGKTALVKRVYESSQVIGGHFNCRAWVTVSESFNKKEVLKKLLRKFFPDSNQLQVEGRRMDELELAEKIKSHLKDKRYVIVLDDIWSIDAWNSMKLVLPDSNNGSRVMVTTRFENVAHTCSSLNHKHVHKLNPLSSKHSRDLLCRKVFDDPDHYCPTHLVGLSERILRKCRGLPLAIVTIGGLLASKPNKTSHVEWQHLLEHLGSELETNPTLKGINQILALSYNDLPYHLRKCFLYLSIFPEDYEISRKRLIRLWITEGFVAERRDMTMENVAESYFDELISRSVILPADINYMGKVKTCQVHDIMLEFILTKSMEENLVHLFGNRRTSLPQNAIRRLSIHARSSVKQISGDMSLPDDSCLRSLFVFPGAKQSFVTPNLTLLRVLDLEGCRYLNNDHLRDLGEFRHLRYLNLKYTSIYELPESFGKLRNLETFDFRGGCLRNIPIGIINLQKLRYILGGNGFKPIKLPNGIGNLKALQALSTLHLDQTKGTATEIGKLIQLRKLSIVFRTQETGVDICTSISNLSNCLRALEVYSSEFLPTINCISSPPLLLESLKFNGCLGKLPSWVASLHNLVKLTLEGTELEDEAIQVLQDLPNLVKLSLHKGSCKRNQLSFGCEGFSSLKVLRFASWKLKSLRFEGGAMPKLELLEMVWYCTLEEVVVGLEHLASLKEVRTDGTDQRMVNMICQSS